MQFLSFYHRTVSFCSIYFHLSLLFHRKIKLDAAALKMQSKKRKLSELLLCRISAKENTTRNRQREAKTEWLEAVWLRKKR